MCPRPRPRPAPRAGGAASGAYGRSPPGSTRGPAAGKRWPGPCAPDPPSDAHGGRDGPRLEVARPLEVGRALDRRMVAADGALRVAPNLELPEGHVQGVVAEEPAHQRIADAQEDLDCLGGLDQPHHP